MGGGETARRGGMVRRFWGPAPPPKGFWGKPPEFPQPHFYLGNVSNNTHLIHVVLS